MEKSGKTLKQLFNGKWGRKEWQRKSIKVLLRWVFIYLWKYIPALCCCSHHSERSINSLLVLVFFWGHGLRSHKQSKETTQRVQLAHWHMGMLSTVWQIGLAFPQLGSTCASTLRKFRYFIKLGSKWKIWRSQVMHKFHSLACHGF